jgi:hypothetical protein
MNGPEIGRAKGSQFISRVSALPRIIMNQTPAASKRRRSSGLNDQIKLENHSKSLKSAVGTFAGSSHTTRYARHRPNLGSDRTLHLRHRDSLGARSGSSCQVTIPPTPSRSHGRFRV